MRSRSSTRSLPEVLTEVTLSRINAVAVSEAVPLDAATLKVSPLALVLVPAGQSKLC